jgi:acetyl/propionyl-CoA carboxylase alpha subunit
LFKRVLVANRGQIAVRIMQTCQELGIRTIGVFSQQDANSPHVFLADEAYCLGEKDNAYSDVEALLRFANKANAEAIHPGYGLLSEDTNFIETCASQKIVFVGPSAELTRRVLNRRTIREAAKRAGLPLVPEAKIGERTKLDEAKVEASKMGYPVVIKPSSGSGKGMRVVESEKDFQFTLENERRESFSHFGSYDVIVEKFLPNVRYLEVPFAMDSRGTYVIFPKSDGSIQRRRNPLIEECPAFGLPDATREELRTHTIALAKEMSYVGFGICQFLYDQDSNQIYFLEMSTTLNAGHPATEMVTGVDLVELQLRLAAGEPLNFKYSFIRPRGVAFACRIAAEDPTQDFMTTIGKVAKLHEAYGPGIRVDSGLYEGQPIAVQKDAILAQVVVHGFDREKALARLQRALNSTVILGLTTNVPFLGEVSCHPELVKKPVTTMWLYNALQSWEPPTPTPEAFLGIVVADALAEQKEGLYAYRIGRVRLEATVTRKGKQYEIEIDGKRQLVQVDPFTPGSVRVVSPLRPGQDIWADYGRAEQSRYVSVGGRCYYLTREA